ncbi:hypothetical protein ACM258_09320 [Phaeobacter piscinae]|uniref:hypothetical protein n=1 Tax=Phaeobacter piscinae TaxID=1580596 RepID=UPI0039F7136D
MLSTEEREAHQLAKELVLQAAREHWKYVCLSPFYNGETDLRKGFEVLGHLSTLPDEVRQLKAGTFIELRGTQIEDLRPLAHIDGLGKINFDGIPAAYDNAELKAIAGISDAEERTRRLADWLGTNTIEDPPEVMEGGPEFIVDDQGPVKLVDPPLTDSDDEDQDELHDECRRKAAELLKIVELAANVAPDLPTTVQQYADLIGKDPSGIRST